MKSCFSRTAVNIAFRFPLLYYVVVFVVLTIDGAGLRRHFIFGDGQVSRWPRVDEEKGEFIEGVTIGATRVITSLRCSTTSTTSSACTESSNNSYFALARCISRVTFVGVYCRVRPFTFIVTRAGVIYTQTGGCIGRAHHACRHCSVMLCADRMHRVCVCVLFCFVPVWLVPLSLVEVRVSHVYVDAACTTE